MTGISLLSIAGCARMTELILGLLLSLLALLGFLFNIYIVLALLLTKQVSPQRQECLLPCVR